MTGGSDLRSTNGKQIDRDLTTWRLCEDKWLVVTINGGFTSLQQLFIFLFLGLAVASIVVTENAVRRGIVGLDVNYDLHSLFPTSRLGLRLCIKKCCILWVTSFLDIRLSDVMAGMVSVLDRTFISTKCLKSSVWPRR